MSFKKQEIEKLLASTGRLCCICRSLHNIQVHHILSKENGGTDSIDNAIPLCPSCHDRVHVKPSKGHTTRDYSPDELRLHRNRMIAEINLIEYQEKSDKEKYDNTEQCPGWAQPTLENKELIDITLSSLAKKDCRKMGIHPNKLRSFIKGEFSRHPLMFIKNFSSLSLLFGDNVLLLNWDCKIARIERILSRQDAYPLNDLWTACLGFYRKATLLPYRTQQQGYIFLSTDAKFAIAVFQNLVNHLERFLKKIKHNLGGNNQGSIHMGQFLNEAEFALANGDIGTAVARFEAVLSTAHKVILQNVPQGIGVKQVFDVKVRKLNDENPNKKSILIVEDEPCLRDLLSKLIECNGYQCFSATCSHDALRLLVGHEFDLILTDLVMPDQDGLNCTLDGRELVLAIKKSGSKAKIIIVSAFSNMATNADIGTEKFPCDAFVSKPFVINKLLEEIRKTLGDKN